MLKVIIYITLLLDNLLLTIIVPILPDYLAHLDLTKIVTVKDSVYKEAIYDNTTIVLPLKTTSMHYNPMEESSSIGALLSVKALTQLIFNPFVGNITVKSGYYLPIIWGTICLLISSIAYALGRTYLLLVVARSVHGIASACIGICCMSLIAQNHKNEKQRSKMMGIILGSIALGVLFGYLFGGISNDLFGKTTPFIILAIIIIITLGLQLSIFDLSFRSKTKEITENCNKCTQWKPLLRHKLILGLIISILISTSTMAVLEPCLPVWLLQNLHATKWQLGIVFIPDSIGYFLGTSIFGSISYKCGQVLMACCSLLLIGISTLFIPYASKISELLLPHFCLGLGIGIVDSAAIPLLATLVDNESVKKEQSIQNMKITTNEMGPNSNYGIIYAMQQTSVSLAYCLAPLLGGKMCQLIGFVCLMIIMGLCNIIFSIILAFIYYKHQQEILIASEDLFDLKCAFSRKALGSNSKYQKLNNFADV